MQIDNNGKYYESSIAKSQKRINVIMQLAESMRKKLTVPLIFAAIILSISYPGLVSWIPLVGYVVNIVSGFFGKVFMPEVPENGIHKIVADLFNYTTSSPMRMFVVNVILWGILIIYLLLVSVLLVLKAYNKINSSIPSDLISERCDLLSKKELSVINKDHQDVINTEWVNPFSDVNYLRIQKIANDFNRSPYDITISLYREPNYTLDDGNTKIEFNNNTLFVKRIGSVDVKLSPNVPFLLYNVENSKPIVSYCITWIQ